MTGLVLAVDGGSQSTKVSVVDTDGVVHATARRALRPYDLGPGGRAVHPDDDLWDSLVATCRDVLDAFTRRGGDTGAIVAVGLCGVRSCRALLDAEGHLVEPVLSWMDDRIGQPVADLDPRVATLCSAGGYLTGRLTGARRDSAASYDGLWPIDLVTRSWSTDPTDHTAAGTSPDLLPELVDPAGLLGHVTDEAAAATGLPSGLPVHATGNDKAVEALGCGLGTGDDDRLLVSLGTYVTSMTEGAPSAIDRLESRYWVNAAAVPGAYLLESGGVRRGMWTVSWWRGLLAEAAGRRDDSTLLGWLEEGAGAVPPGSEGLVTVPDWLPPAHAPWRRGVLLGFGGGHGPHHVHRSILEGLALTMRGHVASLEDAVGGHASRDLVVAGGGARSDLMMQIVADVLGRPATRPREPDAAGIGAAVCAAVGAGLHRDVVTATAAMVGWGATFEPDPASTRRYAEVAAAYAELPGLLDPAFRRLARAFD